MARINFKKFKPPSGKIFLDIDVTIFHYLKTMFSGYCPEHPTLTRYQSFGYIRDTAMSFYAAQDLCTANDAPMLKMQTLEERDSFIQFLAANGEALMQT